MSKRHYSIGELAELTGITRRSVRYYVQRGLLPPPSGAGRGHYYTEAHCQRIRRIQQLQAAGYTLDEISPAVSTGRKPVPPSTAPPEKEPDLWIRLPVQPGLELHLQSGRFRLSPVRLARLARSVGAIAATTISPRDSEPVERKGKKDHR